MASGVLPPSTRWRAGSVGLQIGAQDAEVLFIVMTDKGLHQVIKNS